MVIVIINDKAFLQVSEKYLLYLGSKWFIRSLSPVDLLLLIAEKLKEKGIDKL